MEIRLQSVTWTHCTSSVIEIIKKGTLLSAGDNPDYQETLKHSLYYYLGWRSMPVLLITYTTAGKNQLPNRGKTTTRFDSAHEEYELLWRRNTFQSSGSW